MSSIDYYVAYNIVDPADIDMATMEGRAKFHTGGNSYVTRVTIIDGYTKADKETFERIIRISESGARVEVTDWTPADCDMYVKVNS